MKLNKIIHKLIPMYESWIYNDENEKKDWYKGSGLIAIALLLERFGPLNSKIIDFITGLLLGGGILLILLGYSRVRYNIKRWKSYLTGSDKF